MRTAGLALFCWVLFYSGFAWPQAAPPRAVCAAARLASMVSPPAHIESANKVPANGDLPAHCSVIGYIEHGTRIGFQLGLPDDWNRKFMFIGIGGFAGSFDPIAPGLARGYATATTDTGHKGGLEDATWALRNPAGVINHYESSVELSAQALKSLTAAYYGAVPAHAFFQGCSAGGRQGIVEAERFPGTFDGIIAGAPAWNYSKLLISFVENGQYILGSPDRWIAPETFAAIDRVVLKQCDKLDGAEDGIVTDPRQCRPDLRELLCKPGARSASCLTRAQLRTLDHLVDPGAAKKKRGYFGYRLSGADSGGVSWGWPEWFFGTLPPLKDSGGRLNFAGDVLPKNADHGKGPNQFLLGEQFFRYMLMDDPDYDARKLDPGLAERKLQRRFGDLLDADDTDLDRYLRSGGKLLIWHGWADPAIPAEMTIDLYERMKRDTQGVAGQPAFDDSVRLFMAPGVQHCGGGSGLAWFDPISALEVWVEQGRPPERIVARQFVDGKPTRSRPLCAYPKSAHYRGAGNPDDAESFDCH